MAILGRWTGGAKAQGNLPETWSAPTDLFDFQARNDGDVYNFASSTSTLTLPSSSLANGYLMVGFFHYEDTSNGRFNPQARFIQTAGTGNFVSAQAGGYNRDTSEDRSYVRVWAIVDGPSAAAQFQFQWKADTDDATGGTVRSCLDIIPLFYSDIGLYQSTTAGLYGGTTPNKVTGFSGVDGTNITIASDTVTVTGDNKRHLCFGSFYREGAGTRTQRWGGFTIDGLKQDEMKACAYFRQASDDQSGGIYSGLFFASTTNRTVETFCYRGDGVGAGQGGADVDGSTGSNHLYTMVVIELNDTAEIFTAIDDDGGTQLNVSGPVDIPFVKTTNTVFNDATSFTRSTDIGFNIEKDMDVLLGVNLSAAQQVVSTTSRWTAAGFFTKNGAEDLNTEHGNYLRNNQGSIDTFGWSANLISFMDVVTDDDIGVSIQELAGGEAGGDPRIQPGWGGFWGLNLDSLQGVATQIRKIKVGANQVDRVYLGTTEVDRVYLGNNLIFEK